jgi:hypothetical protein
VATHPLDHLQHLLERLQVLVLFCGLGRFVARRDILVYGSQSLYELIIYGIRISVLGHLVVPFGTRVKNLKVRMGTGLLTAPTRFSRKQDAQIRILESKHPFVRSIRHGSHEIPVKTREIAAMAERGCRWGIRVRPRPVQTASPTDQVVGLHTVGAAALQELFRFTDRKHVALWRILELWKISDVRNQDVSDLNVARRHSCPRRLVNRLGNGLPRGETFGWVCV